jgi:hypothetical protein
MGVLSIGTANNDLLCFADPLRLFEGDPILAYVLLSLLYPDCLHVDEFADAEFA